MVPDIDKSAYRFSLFTFVQISESGGSGLQQMLAVIMTLVGFAGFLSFEQYAAAVCGQCSHFHTGLRWNPCKEDRTAKKKIREEQAITIARTYNVVCAVVWVEQFLRENNHVKYDEPHFPRSHRHQIGKQNSGQRGVHIRA